MKKITVTLFALILTACAAKKTPETDISRIKTTEKSEKHLTEAGPDDFEKNMPASSVLRQSLVIFENTYSRVYSDDNVINAAAGDSMAAVLKPGEISFTTPACPALVLDGDFSDLSVSGYDVLVYSSSRLDYYSAYDCVRYASLKKALRGPAVLVDKFILEWNGAKAVMREAHTGGIIFNGDMGSPIASAGKIGGKPVFVLFNKYIMAYNENAKAFIISGSFPLDFDTLLFASGTFYGTLKTGEFFTIDDNNSNITAYKDCALSPSSPYAICDDALTDGGKKYARLPPSITFSSGAGLYLTINKGNLNIYSLKNSWQRFVSFGYEKPVACLDDSGTIYFKGFSGKSYKISGMAESETDETPGKKCSLKGVSFRGGKFICGEKECGTFAEEVNSDLNATMFRRNEDGKIYYYFEEAEQP